MDLENKVVLITGSSTGIGAAAAKVFAKEGSRVVVTYFRSRGEAEKVARECTQLGAPEVLLLKLNLMENQSIKECVAEVVQRFGQIDLLINNAGVLVWKSVSRQSFEEIEYQIKTNLEGLIKITHQARPFLKEMVINISSQGGLRAGPSSTVYSATKFGIIGFTQGLALEEKDIKVYCINPRGTATQMNDWEGPDSPEDVANVILNTAKGKYHLKTGDYINVWEVL
jgi:3-oxoacyl-[acyl-carrier protein] reductase